jgi:hypothetical protein
MGTQYSFPNFIMQEPNPPGMKDILAIGKNSEMSIVSPNNEVAS